MELKEESQIFTEDIPKYGKVALLFYIPETVANRDSMVELIRSNGGNTVNFHEWISYQLGPPENTSEHQYFQGLVYSFQWIVDSVDKKRLLDKENYIMATIQKGLDFPYDKKKIQYTIREIVIIYNWISGRKSQASRKTWESLSNDGLLPCRSKESLKNFWKNWRKYPVEECLDKLSSNLKYCHNYKEPILPHQELPEKKKKGKRTREDILELVKEEEPEAGDQENPTTKKRIMKRKLK